MKVFSSINYLVSKKSLSPFSYLVLLFFLLTSIPSIAQNYGGSHANGDKKHSYNELPPIGSISGSIVDSVTGQSLEYATVTVLLKQNDSLVSGAITNSKGQFYIKEMRPGKYKVKIDFIGFNSKVIDNVFINQKKTDIELNKIILAPSTATLEGFTLVEEKPFMEIDLDKKVFNVDKNLSTEGESGTEVLEQIPGIEVDMDGNVSLRGTGNVRILIDGKPSGLGGTDIVALLESIPAATIEKVELITNPSAKYDPDGISGIINIVLKKNKLRGFNGNISTSVGTKDKYNGSINLNYRNDHFNIFTVYSYRNYNSSNLNEVHRKSIFSDSVAYLDQWGIGNRLKTSNMVRGGIDYYINSKNSISASLTYDPSGGEHNDMNKYEEKDGLLQPFSFYDRNSVRTDNNKSMDYDLYYYHSFKTKDETLIADAAYSTSERNRLSTSNNGFYDFLWQQTDSVIATEFTNETTQNNVYTFSLDYTKPLKNEGRLELGAKSINRAIDNDYNFRTGFSDFNNSVSDSAKSNQFIYNEHIHSVYATYGRKFGKINALVGLRGESAFTASLLINNDSTYNNVYYSLFPNAHFSYEFKNKQQMQLSYSRRINRPSFRNLNPFTDFSDPLNLRIGNPNLLPEYVNSLELGYIYSFKKKTITYSFFYRNTNNAMDRIRTLDSTGVSTLMFENIASSTSFGGELIAILNPAKWLKINGSFSAYQSVFDGTNLGSGYSNSGLGYYTRWTVTAYPWKTGTIELSCFYKGKSPHTQGELQPFFSVDIAVKQNFLQDKASLSLKMRDIFDSMKFRYNSIGTGYEQSGIYDRESQILMLTFSYRFGKMQFDKKRKSSKDGYNQDNEYDGGM